MGWQIALAAAGAAFGGFNAYDEYHANRQIRRDLEKIQAYLLGIDRKLDQVLEQNRQVLKVLDQLPSQFRQIVQEVVDEALLRERYSVIRDVRDNFLILRGGRSYRLTSEQWREFSRAMGYLFEYEHRLSKTFTLVAVCEIALAITKERALPLVVHRLRKKRGRIAELREDVVYDLESKLTAVKAKLDNTAFIRSHNLSDDLQDVGQLTFEGQPNRNTTQHFSERVCEWRHGGRYGEDRQVCRHERRTRSVPDNAFHKARDKYVARIESDIEAIKETIARIRELNGVLGSYDIYIDRIENQSLVVLEKHVLLSQGAAKSESGAELDVLPMYFDGSSESKKDATDALDEDDFDDYIDGCHGKCDTVDDYLIKSGNRSFKPDRPRHCEH